MLVSSHLLTISGAWQNCCTGGVSFWCKALMAENSGAAFIKWLDVALSDPTFTAYSTSFDANFRNKLRTRSTATTACSFVNKRAKTSTDFEAYLTKVWQDSHPGQSVPEDFSGGCESLRLMLFQSFPGSPPCTLHPAHTVRNHYTKRSTDVGALSHMRVLL